MAKLAVGSRMVGEEFPPLVIAEIGINHGGSLEVAKAMVTAAKDAGAEVVKHQTHVIDDEMSHVARAVIPGNSDKPIYDIMEECALSEEDELELKHFVERLGLVFLSTPFSRAAADRLRRWDVVAYKIGSGECNNYPLVEHIASFGKPVILSTGMNTLESVRGAVRILRRYSTPFALLHTTNLYPTPPHLVRLGAMAELREAFPDAVIGLSDHTVNNNACLAAAAMGAALLERHFTDSKCRPGPDIVNSADPEELRLLITGTREIYHMRGGRKEPVEEERVTSAFAFATVVTIKPIEKGEELTEGNLWVKRPGTGEIKAAEFSSLLGRRASRSIPADAHLTWKDVL